MSACYVVVHVFDGQVMACETYAGSSLAMARANHIVANDTYKPSFGWNNPVPEKLENGVDLKWLFYDFSNESVTVFFKRIQVGYLDVHKDPTPPIHFPTLVATQISIGDLIRAKLSSEGNLPGDDAFADPLPAGWNFMGNPITMQQMKEDPESYKTMYGMTEDEKWALVTARVSKRPKFFTIHLGKRYAQHNVLDELKARSQAGLEMRDKEIKMLDEYYCDLCDTLDALDE